MRGIVVWVVVLAGCGQTVVDNGSPCLSLQDGVVLAEVTFTGGEQAPSDPTCTLTVDGDRLLLTTEVFYEADRSPFSSTMILTMSSTTCEATVADDVTSVVVEYAGHELAVEDDAADEPACWQLNASNGTIREAE